MYAILNLYFSMVFHLSLSNLAPNPWCEDCLDIDVGFLCFLGNLQSIVCIMLLECYILLPHSSIQFQ